MKARKYALPEFLKDVLSQDKYERWLRRKAAAHLKRDRKYGNLHISGESYRIAIHEAVVTSKGKDAYTGDDLDWKLLSTYSNVESKKGRRKYKASLSSLPTVDHVDERTSLPNFKICSWRVNDAKGDLNLSEFLELCRKLIEHNDAKS